MTYNLTAIFGDLSNALNRLNSTVSTLKAKKVAPIGTSQVNETAITEAVTKSVGQHVAQNLAVHVTSLKQNITVLEKAGSASEAKVQALESEVSDLKTSLDESDDTLYEVKLGLEGNVTLIETVKNATIDLGKELADVKNDLTDVENKAVEIDTDLSGLKNDVNQNITEIAHLLQAYAGSVNLNADSVSAINNAIDILMGKSNSTDSTGTDGNV